MRNSLAVVRRGVVSLPSRVSTRALVIGSAIGGAVAVGYAPLAGATGIVDFSSLETTILAEITTNLPYIIGVFAVITVIGILFHLFRRFAH